MPRLSRRALAFAAASLAAAPFPARAQTPVVPPNTPNSNIFNPLQAPEIIVRIGVRRYILVPRTSGSSTSVSGSTLNRVSPSGNLTNAIAAVVPGVAQAPGGEIHVRGSHGQYTYYLDGAPLPSDVGGSFSDLINPHDIQTLRVLDGGFPPKYGNQLAAIFDVTTQTPHGRPHGFVQQLEEGYATHYSTVEAGGSLGRFSYFGSAIRHSSDFYLSPVTQTPLHDSGLENAGFGKLVYQPRLNEAYTLDMETGGAAIQIPNTPDRQAVGQNDFQRENSSFVNLIWHHGLGPNQFHLALYSHQSRLRYFGSPQDLAPGPPGSPSADPTGLAETFEDQSGNYLGMRLDKQQQITARHHIQYGFDVDQVTGHQLFTARFYQASSPPLLETRYFSGGDRDAYLQDDWTPGRFLIDYGARYDVHQADVTSSQLSPRVNVYYHANGRNTFHAFYDHLFQPVPIEDVKQLSGTAATALAPIKPETDDFFEGGWEHQQGGTTLTLDAYYRDEKNTVDDSVFGNTQIDIPYNYTKGYARGLEAALDGRISPTVSYYVNVARSWAKAKGPITGGLLGNVPNSYIYVDHDQTNTASLGLSYERSGTYADLDAEYGSGFPSGELDQTNSQGQTIYDANGNPLPILLNYIRVEPHTVFNITIGKQFGTTKVAFLVTNLLNDGYVIKQASPFTDTQWGQGRTFGIKLTQNF